MMRSFQKYLTALVVLALALSCVQAVEKERNPFHVKLSYLPGKTLDQYYAF